MVRGKAGSKKFSAFGLFPRRFEDPKARLLSRSRTLLVVHAGKLSKFLRLVFRQCITQKIAAADLRASEVLQQAGLAQRRMKLDMEMKAAWSATIEGAWCSVMT